MDTATGTDIPHITIIITPETVLAVHRRIITTPGATARTAHMGPTSQTMLAATENPIGIHTHRSPKLGNIRRNGTTTGNRDITTRRRRGNCIVSTANHTESSIAISGNYTESTGNHLENTIVSHSIITTIRSSIRNRRYQNTIMGHRSCQRSRQPVVVPLQVALLPHKSLGIGSC